MNRENAQKSAAGKQQHYESGLGPGIEKWYQDEWSVKEAKLTNPENRLGLLVLTLVILLSLFTLSVLA